MAGPLLLYLALTVLLTIGPILGTAPAVASAEQLEGRALVEALRGGGYVLLFRHAATDYSQNDVDRQNLENCATQRNLSSQGREQAVAIGQGFRRLQIPVGMVLASPYCRTLETARLAFGVAEPSPDLISELSDDTSGGRERLTASLRGLLARPPEPGTNTVLVSHTLNIQDAVGLDIEEGEAVVASPDGAGGFTVVARVRAESWDQLDASP
jgi:phosphohistidine phosphatase SixA